ncbi:hypothetical protein F5Y16DRAFT_380333 [Xylariaceae sp. FL0255]|nr:hypothetical protein F5Y16DRAFT_380333 [Xylariaceae sp. FL0255]
MKPLPLTGWAKTWHDERNTDKRRLAIRNFGRELRKPAKWSQAWGEAGGTAGLLYLLSRASVKEVDFFCRIVKVCNRRGKKSTEREAAIEELVKALLPQHYPSTELRTRDKRPLQKCYGHLLRACSSDFVEKVLDEQDKSNPLYQQLNILNFLFAHEEMMKRRLVNHLMNDGTQLPESELNISFTEFCSREPPDPSGQKHVSASMKFSLDMLQARVDRRIPDERWPTPAHMTELNVLMNVYDRFVRKSRNSDKTLLFNLAFKLLDVNPKLRRTPEAGSLWVSIVTLWKKRPEQYDKLLAQAISSQKEHPEDPLSSTIWANQRSNSPFPTIVARWKNDPDQNEHLLILALRHGLGGSKQLSISDNYLRTCTSAFTVEGKFEEPGPEIRWRLLHLYCLHVPKKGVDIDSSSSLQSLANEQWVFEMFDQLNKEQAISLLERLYNENPSFDFLRSPQARNSIYSMRSVGTRFNFNVELLLANYRRHDSSQREKAEDEVDKLRKAAATSREQEDRAIFAKAAANYAIASGHLELYGETLIWQQRFIRDPLTMQSIFRADAIWSPEGIALLSGIIVPPPGSTTLGAVRERLTTANQLLKAFGDTARMAKKEPSYKASQFDAFRSLYCRVYSERISRAKQKEVWNIQPSEGESDLFHIIWEGTADLTRSIGSEFLSNVSSAVLDLHAGLTGPSSISATETLLKAASEWDKRQGGSDDHEKVDGIIEMLSHTCIARLSRSNTPILVRDLIVQAIIDRPAASSWHRQFLSIGFIRSLPTKEAEAMLLSLATAMGEKLEEQSYVNVGEAEPSKSSPPKSLIKVTTVKYLAQLLGEADFIPPDSATEVLIELFKAGTHIDIRLTALDSLLSTLDTMLRGLGEESASNPMVEKIISTLELVIPIAGSVNERRPTSDLDWVEAEEKVTIPSVSDDGGRIPPLFMAILQIARKENSRYPKLVRLQDQFFSRLLLPALDHSQKEHRKWFALFLAKHRPELSADMLPLVPITPKIWRVLLENYGRLLPASVIKEYNQYVLFRMSPPLELKALRTALRRDTKLRNDASVKHWLSVFGEDNVPFSWSSEISVLINFMMSPAASSLPDATKTAAMDAVITQASVVLDDYERSTDAWSHLVKILSPYSSRPKRLDKTWEEDCANRLQLTQTLARNLIKLIQDKSDSHANRDAIWPSTFSLRLRTLPYPIPKDNEQDEEFQHFSASLDLFISLFLNSREGDSLLWTVLAEDILSILCAMYNSTTERLRLAVHIGDLENGPSDTLPAIQLVRSTVAMRLFDSISHVIAPRKLTSKSEPEKMTDVGKLAQRLSVAMNRWRLYGGRDFPGPVAVRDLFLQWRHKNEKEWKVICSWDPNLQRQLKDQRKPNFK